MLGMGKTIERGYAVVTVYEYTNTPRYWIVHDDQGYWLVPARDDGWSERSPFVGHVMALREVSDLGGIDLGISGACDADEAPAS